MMFLTACAVCSKLLEKNCGIIYGILVPPCEHNIKTIPQFKY